MLHNLVLHSASVWLSLNHLYIYPMTCKMFCFKLEFIYTILSKNPTKKVNKLHRKDKGIEKMFNNVFKYIYVSQNVDITSCRYNFIIHCHFGMFRQT